MENKVIIQVPLYCPYFLNFSDFRFTFNLLQFTVSVFTQYLIDTYNYDNFNEGINLKHCKYEVKETKVRKHIEVNPKIMCGKPVIKGTRIPIYIILELLAAGYSFDRILEAYPTLTKEDITAALEYAAAVTKHEETELMEAIK